jgi:hypothetical protein
MSSADHLGPARIRRTPMSDLTGRTSIRPQQKPIKAPGDVHNERRSQVRYPMGLPVTFRSLDKTSLSGEGQALNISDAGVFVTYPKQLQVGSRVELRISWPFLLDRQPTLQLFALGKVVRSTPSGFAVIFRQYQFRTTRERSGQSKCLVAKVGG